MIVPMKKASILILDAAREASLEKLRELGVLHLERKTISSENLSKLIDRRNKAEIALGVLGGYKIDKKAAGSATTTPAVKEHVSAHVIELIDQRKSLQEQLILNGKEISRIEKWGDFNPADLKELSAAGVDIIPYELFDKAYAALTDENRFIVLGKGKNSVYGVAVGAEIEGEQPFVLPECSFSELNDKARDIKTRLQDIEVQLGKLAYKKGNIKAELALLKEQIEFETARAGVEDMGTGEVAVSCISGYAPEETAGVLKRVAAENGWALLIDDPKEEDNPPTLVRNNAFVRLIHPLFSFLGTVPGYREYDISFSYLMFFCLFFAMIFGDAAYGLLLLGAALFAGSVFKKKSGKFPDVFKLFVLLSCCTVVWGALNGAWFAINYRYLPGFLKALVIPQFNSDVALHPFPGVLKTLFQLPDKQPANTAYWNVQFLCFTTAIIQLVWAHIKNIKKLLPSLVAVAQLGWLAMMIGLYFLVLSMLLKIALPGFAVYLIGGGLFTYFIFANQTGGNFGFNIGKSFANFLPTFLNSVSSFGDIISYIRLFAVGIAGSSIAQSANSMALGGGLNGSVGIVVLKLFAACLILAFGHSLNIVMTALSVIVHGVRLNLLEYAGSHLGMEWSGYSYAPFALQQKENGRV
ncbi:MAG: V-type ATP synthase subunit I [Treponema sp.]|nr:V-type ATP synthase subunit I [Treponema sp.]